MHFSGFMILGIFTALTAQAQDFVGQEIETFRRDRGHVALVNGTETDVVIEYAPAYNSHINVMYPDGKTAVLQPHEVKWFTTGNYYFITTSETGEGPTPATTEDYDGDFVQVVDTGKVVIVRGYKIGTYPNGGGNYIIGNLLIRRREDKAWTKFPKGGINSTSPKFRTLAARFLTGREDLLDALERKVITVENFERCLKAYNHGGLVNFNQE